MGLKDILVIVDDGEAPADAMAILKAVDRVSVLAVDPGGASGASRHPG